MPFLLSLQLFYGLLVLSSLACGVLFLAHQKEGKNLLLRFCCLMILFMYLVIVAGHLNYGGFHQVEQGFCEAQAVLLNYCYICIHAFACFMLFNNSYISFGWRISVFEDRLNREWTLALLALSLPLISVLTIIVILSDVPSKPLILVGPFFCSITRPKFETSVFWFGLFALPGSAAAVYHLYKPWRARRRAIINGSVTQITMPYLIRLTTSTFLYLFLAFGSMVPLMLISDAPMPILTKPILLPAEPLRSPWTNPDLCTVNYNNDPIMRYFQRVSCPGALSYFPVITGIMCFLMYGFSFNARQAYKSFFQMFRWSKKRRRKSVIPLHLAGQGPSPAVQMLPIEEEFEGGDQDLVQLRPPSPFCISFPTPEMEQRAREM